MNRLAGRIQDAIQNRFDGVGKEISRSVDVSVLANEIMDVFGRITELLPVEHLQLITKAMVLCGEKESIREGKMFALGFQEGRQAEQALSALHGQNVLAASLIEEGIEGHIDTVGMIVEGEPRVKKLHQAWNEYLEPMAFNDKNEIASLVVPVFGALVETAYRVGVSDGFNLHQNLGKAEFLQQKALKQGF